MHIYSSLGWLPCGARIEFEGQTSLLLSSSRPGLPLLGGGLLLLRVSLLICGGVLLRPLALALGRLILPLLRGLRLRLGHGSLRLSRGLRGGCGLGGVRLVLRRGRLGFGSRGSSRRNGLSHWGGLRHGGG